MPNQGSVQWAALVTSHVLPTISPEVHSLTHSASELDFVRDDLATARLVETYSSAAFGGGGFTMFLTVSEIRFTPYDCFLRHAHGVRLYMSNTAAWPTGHTHRLIIISIHLCFYRS